MANKTKTKKETCKFGVFWTCLECKDSPQLDGAEALKRHLKDAHAFTGDVKQVKAHMQATCHMDGADWFSWAHEGHVILPDGRNLKFARYSCQQRSAEGRAMWEA